MVTAPQYRHVPTGTLAILAQRLGTVWASPSTWYRLVRQHGWRRPRLRVHPAKPKVGLRTTRADEMWHIDTTVIPLARRHPRLSPCRDRQLLATDLGVAGRGDVCAGEQCGRASRSRAGCHPLRDDAGRVGGRGRRERERPGRRPNLHGTAAPRLGLHGAQVLELHDRSVVALLETSMALPPPAGQC